MDPRVSAGGAASSAHPTPGTAAYPELRAGLTPVRTLEPSPRGGLVTSTLLGAGARFREAQAVPQAHGPAEVWSDSPQGHEPAQALLSSAITSSLQLHPRSLDQHVPVRIQYRWAYQRELLGLLRLIRRISTLTMGRRSS
jgi:hypothetical protein